MLNWLVVASKLHKHRETCCTAEWPFYSFLILWFEAPGCDLHLMNAKEKHEAHFTPRHFLRKARVISCIYIEIYIYTGCIKKKMNKSEIALQHFKVPQFTKFLIEIGSLGISDVE